MNPIEFQKKWLANTLKERTAAQEHFLDLCALVNHPTPTDLDPTGEFFTFEKGASKLRGTQPRATSGAGRLRGAAFHASTCGVRADIWERCANNSEQMAA